MKSLKNLGKINWVIGISFQFLLLPLSVSCALIGKVLFFTQLILTGCLQSERVAIDTFFFFFFKTGRNRHFPQPVKPKGFSGGFFLEGARESFHIYSDFSPKMVNILFFNPQLPISLLFNFTS